MIEAFLGIDISKKTFDVALLVQDKISSHKFNNNIQGFQSLLAWLKKKEILLLQACMEATGIYGQALAEFLFAQKISVSIVNPARIKGFSQSELARSKNDILDAKLIARFCKLIRPELWQPIPQSIKVLQQWVRRLDDLIKMLRQEENRLDVAEDCLKKHLQKNIKHLENSIKEVRQIIKTHIHQHPEFRRSNYCSNTGFYWRCK